MSHESLYESLERAVAAAPDDVALRLHLAEVLLQGGRATEAVGHCARALAILPSSTEAKVLMSRAISHDPSLPDTGSGDESADPRFDWHSAEKDLGPRLAPMFADSDPARSEVARYDVESSSITLADVGGLAEVKQRLEAAFLAPLRNPELRRMYRKSLRGGLLLYGPPGVGKTFVARALAGELGAAFLPVSIHDVLDMYVGQSERNVHEIFESARASAPCVVFLDEVDALGHRRSRLSSDSLRTSVNQLLLELDSVGGDNDGVFVLAASNHPWDIDPALRRPGRLDRTLLVLPPDAEARAAIWTMHLRDRPVAGIDVTRLARMSDGYTGADIAHVCESAAERALLDAARTGDLRMVMQRDIEAALKEVRPSVGAWFSTARNVATFANDDGSYDELLRYLRTHQRRR